MTDKIAVDEMNVLTTIPANTAGLFCEAKFLAEDGVHQANAYYSAADLHKAFDDFSFYNEGYFADHTGVLADGTEYPVLLTMPEMAYRVKMYLVSLQRQPPEDMADDELPFDLATEIRTLERDAIRKAREDFLKYIPDGDEYDAIYTLTDEGRAHLESMAKEDDE